MIDNISQFLMGFSVMLSLMLTCVVLGIAIILGLRFAIALATGLFARPPKVDGFDHPYIKRGADLDETR